MDGQEIKQKLLKSAMKGCDERLVLAIFALDTRLTEAMRRIEKLDNWRKCHLNENR